LSPRTSPKLTAVPPKTSPLLVTPTLIGGRPSRNIFSNAPFLRTFDCTSVCCIGAWKSMIGPGAPKSAEAAVCSGSFRSSVRIEYSFLK
jgi:hypothetical protein